LGVWRKIIAQQSRKSCRRHRQGHFSPCGTGSVSGRPKKDPRHAPESTLVFCRTTQMGLLRLLTNSKVMGRSRRTVVQAWETFAELLADRRVIFATEPARIELAWRQLMTQAGVGPSSWPDAYLPAFAEAHLYSPVTFDAGFRRWPALRLTLLSPAQNLPGE